MYTSIKFDNIANERIHPIVEKRVFEQIPGQQPYPYHNDKYLVPLIEFTQVITISQETLKSANYDVLSRIISCGNESIIKAINYKIDYLLEQHPFFTEIFLYHNNDLELWIFDQPRYRNVEYIFQIQCGIIFFTD